MEIWVRKCYGQSAAGAPVTGLIRLSVLAEDELRQPECEPLFPNAARPLKEQALRQPAMGYCLGEASPDGLVTVQMAKGHMAM